MSETKSALKKRPYHHIDDSVREELVKLIEKQYGKMDITIRSIAERLNINYSTAKTILNTYRKEGRTKKKKPNKSIHDQIVGLDGKELMKEFDFTRYNREVVNSFVRRTIGESC